VISGAGLVFLHGAGARGEVWQLQALAFPQAVIPDLPGRDGRGTPHAVADHVAALRPHLERAAVAVGHSLGGAIVLQYALEQPPRLRGIVLVATGARLRVRPEWLEGLERDYLATTAEIVAHFYAPSTPDRLRQKSLEVMRHLPQQVTRADFLSADGFDVRDRLGGVLVPALVICGILDEMTPLRYSEFLHAHLPQAELVAIEGAGHMVMLEQPQAVSEAIRGFLRRLTGAPTGEPPPSPRPTAPSPAPPLDARGRGS